MAMQLLLENINTPGLNTLPVYKSFGGYSVLEKSLKLKDADIVEEVKKSGLRGRGGAVPGDARMGTERRAHRSRRA